MVKFNEFEYVRPNADKVNAAIIGVVERIKAAKSFEELDNAILAYDEINDEVETHCCVAYVRNQLNIEDNFYKDEMDAINKFDMDIAESKKELFTAVLESKFVDKFEEKYGRLMIDKLKGFLGISVKGNEELMAKEHQLNNEYDRLMHNIRVEFEGKECSQHELADAKQDADDKRRFEAWSASGRGYATVQEELDRVFDQLVKVRTQLAIKCGYKDYVDMAYVLRGRNCFTKQDIEKFREAVAKHYVPLQEKLARQQAKRLGVSYPMNFAENTMPLREGLPQPVGTKEDTLNTAMEIFRELSPKTKAFADYIQQYGLMDTSTSRQKRSGGFCIDMPYWKAGFLFSHFGGNITDVNSIRHEGGHAYAGYVNGGKHPHWHYIYTQEIAETHSQGMEIVTLPYIDRFFGDRADAYTYSLISEWVSFIPYACIVDHFQQTVYEKPELTPEERIALWKELMAKYMPWIKLGEIPFYGDGRHWQRQPHIFTMPFYFIDYCLSMLLAMQIFAIQQDSKEEALEKYLDLVEQGGTKTFVDLAIASGMESPISPKAVEYSAQRINEWLDGVDMANIK